jgi:hypothetical protein
MSQAASPPPPGASPEISPDHEDDAMAASPSTSPQASNVNSRRESKEGLESGAGNSDDTPHSPKPPASGKNRKDREEKCAHVCVYVLYVCVREKESV